MAGPWHAYRFVSTDGRWACADVCGLQTSNMPSNSSPAVKPALACCSAPQLQVFMGAASSVFQTPHKQSRSCTPQGPSEAGKGAGCHQAHLAYFLM